MSASTQSNPFSCTYEGCLGRFQTKGQLKHHKITRHDYCITCDLDFKDDAAFLVHKVGSEKHITCPVCSEDFRSTDGRDRHVRQAHAADQNLRCIGCSEVFKRAGGLMDHLERDRCPQIKSADFEKHRAIKEIFMAQIASQVTERPGSVTATSDDGDSGEEAGGVSVKMSSLLDNLEDDNSVDYPTLHPASAVPLGSRTVSATTLHASAWPELGASRSGGWNTATGTLNKNTARETPTENTAKGTPTENTAKRTPTENTAMRTADADVSEPVQDTDTQQESTTAWGGSSSATLFPDAPKTPVTLNWTTSILDPSNSLNTRNEPKIVLESTMDPNSPRFNPHQFRNAIGMFKCPYPRCSKSFPNPKTFTAHLQSPAHKTTDHRCPACLKIFKSPTALTQHMEAPTNRCNIKETANFGQAISLVSGGYLSVEGKHADGTVKFETEEPQW
ncbi:Zinc finger, C2H2-like [Lasallia pustulata]|uniref:Zinc finger, C2H2-like n=1 Tax=Lasallia pustulata TaxID=136370 RepID=A0A1W5D5F1_9LECA|nr:Zinc finger, C2H2-like [Lasallia pustulata]